MCRLWAAGRICRVMIKESHAAEGMPDDASRSRMLGIVA